MSKKKLPPKQRLFLKEWAIDKNASEAYKRAYKYKGTHADSLGHNLYVKLCKGGFFEAEIKSQEDELVFTARQVREEIDRLLKVDPALAFDKDHNLLPIHQIPKDIRRAMAGFDVSEETITTECEVHKSTRIIKVKFWDKNTAIITAARSLQMLIDKVSHSGVVTIKSLLTDKGIPIND